jgi:tricorn protease
MKRVILSTVLLLSIYVTFGQISAKLFRYADISQSQITFVYGGDIWLVPKSGGTANRLTSSPGEESFPKFSPDGQTIAYTATYNNNADVYTIASNGGLPARITYNSMPDRMIDWHPDGNKVLFASPRESGIGRLAQFFLVSKKGGLPEKLAMPYAELGSFSPDGESIAYVTRITENYPFKRYRGGFASDVLVYNLKQNKVENITQNPATDGKPAWVKNKIFYVSDVDKSQRRNIWVYDAASKKSQQLTKFNNEDVNYMSAGPSDLVFEAGGKLYVLNADNYKYDEVKINVVSDISSVMPRSVNVGRRVQAYTVSPDARRAIFAARGELFNVPAEEGYVLNMTASSGALDRNPAWSPDGKYIAYWSDASGENEIYIRETSTGANPKKLTSFGKGFGFNLFWSPDSKKIAFIDYEQAIKVITVATSAITTIDKTSKKTFSSLWGFRLNWSPDSKWLTYSKETDNMNEAVFLYSFDANKVHQVTSGYYDDSRPVFDPGGKYIFFMTDRSFNPSYSNVDGSWIYANATQVAAAALDPSTKSILPAKNDEVKVTSSDTSSAKPEEKKSPAPPKEESKPAADAKAMKVNVEQLEARVEVLPLPSGNYGTLYAVDGKLIYHRFANTGASGGAPAIYFYDIEKREEKTLMNGANSFAITGNGKSILAEDAQGYGIISIAPDQTIKKRFPTTDMNMMLNPREEWAQIFNDTWRRYRDFFYDPGMHQVNWASIRKQYGDMVNDAITRWDISNIQLQMISELSAGHTYAGGGDVEGSTFRECGFLGIDWAVDNNKYKIKRIVRPAAWDNEVRSPFDKPGIGVKEGDYIISINGQDLDANIDPFAVLEGLAGKTIVLKVNGKPAVDGAREITIKTISQYQEGRLRHLEWIESNRKKVEELSGGQLGYMYMPNTGVEGQTELLRQFYAQVHKKGFVIDERFNAGGQLADRFIEMLNRPVLYNLAWRNADVTVWPVKANDGPKVMLINGWAGSGGDAFPWAFQQLNLGPIIGERTLGILVGPATGHGLIDGGSITVPDARLYGANGKWFAEGYGIKPDIEVWDDPSLLAKGEDPQLKRAVEECMKLVQSKPRKLHPRPAFENRTAAGF